MSQFTYVKPSRPCRICRGVTDCRVSASGLWFCKRRHSELADDPALHYVGESRDGLWGMYGDRSRDWSEDPRTDPNHPYWEKRQEELSKPRSGRPPFSLFEHVCESGELLSDHRIKQLAMALNLEVFPGLVDAIQRVGARWLANDSYNRHCFVFPERDGDGQLVGWSFRYPDGSKRSCGQRGVIQPDGWIDRPGPVYVVEGASDTICMVAMGFACLARPSNTGGGEILARLFRERTDREVVILGENDRKGSNWPGRYGAERIAWQLAPLLRGAPWVALPPETVKDVRQWFVAKSVRSDRQALESGDKFVHSLSRERRRDPPTCRTGADGGTDGAALVQEAPAAAPLQRRSASMNQMLRAFREDLQRMPKRQRVVPSLLQWRTTARTCGGTAVTPNRVIPKSAFAVKRK